MDNFTDEPSDREDLTYAKSFDCWVEQILTGVAEYCSPTHSLRSFVLGLDKLINSLSHRDLKHNRNDGCKPTELILIN